jgi:flagellin
MAAEIDRIANATNFNGVKLLDGSLNSQNGGQGIRIHFGTGNSAAEDYYYVKTDDVRATSTTGLRIGGDGTNDIWSTGAYGDFPGGCCAGSIGSLSSVAVSNQGRAFAYGYNWDGEAASETALFNGRYLAGRYGIESGMSYEDLIASVNAGTQSRIMVEITNFGFTVPGNTTNYAALCLGEDEVYYYGSTDVAAIQTITAGKIAGQVAVAATNKAMGFACAINNTEDSKYWAMYTAAAGGNPSVVTIFRKDGGDNNGIAAEVKANGGGATPFSDNFTFVNAETGARTKDIGTFTLGGEHWGTMAALQQGGGGYSLALLGRDIGDGMDLYIAGGGRSADTAFNLSLTAAGITNPFVEALRRTAFTELQDASDGRWVGAEVRTQESAQRALVAINDAIQRKDIIRANIGATANRLEGTIENLTIQVENLQASESRISDVDVATEMTEFTKNNILAQAATSMLAQANSLGALALTLIMGG